MMRPPHRLTRRAVAFAVLLAVAFAAAGGLYGTAGVARGDVGVFDPTLEFVTSWGTNVSTPGFVPPPVRAGEPAEPGAVVAAAAPTAKFEVTYHGFSPEAKAAFQRAVDIWSELISSPVTITIDATWKDIGGFNDRGLIRIGQAATAGTYSDFPAAPRPKTSYSAALANKLMGRDLNQDDPDIFAEFNSNSAIPWYFGTDGRPPSTQLDFTTNVLHEIGHGLGFTSRMRVADGKGRWDVPEVAGKATAFDRFVHNASGKMLVSFDSPSADLATQIQGGQVWFSGANELSASDARRARLYAPPTWEQGSSISHLDESEYKPGTPNSLMTPTVNAGEAVHNPGPIALGIMRDIGWATTGSGSMRALRGGLANGVSAIDAVYAGSTSSSGDHLGDKVQFSVLPSPGSKANPRFENGANTITVPIGGTACTAAPDSPPFLVATARCFALARFKSDTAGGVDVVARNTSANDLPAQLVGPVLFQAPRAIVPALRKGGGESALPFVQNTGPAASGVVIDYYTSAGAPVPGSAFGFENVAPGGRVSALFGTNTAVPSDFVGVALIGSDQPVAAETELLHDRTRGRLALSLGAGYPITPGITGDVISLPYVANALEAAYNTSFFIVNTGATVACASITYAFVPGAGAIPANGKAPLTDAGPGGGGCERGYPVPVNGQVGFAPSASPGFREMPEATRNTLMAATVTITGGSARVLVEAFTTDGTAKSAAYDGFLVSGTGTGVPPSDLGTDITIPLALKTADGYYTQILLSNPGSSPANVTITYAAEGKAYPVTLTVPANGVANHSVYSDKVVPLGFVGAATVKSNQPVAAVLFRAKKVSPDSDFDEDLYTAVNGTPTPNAARTVALPLIFRRLGKTAGLDGTNSWISVSVPGGGTASVTLRAVNVGCLAGDPLADTVITTVKQVKGSFVFYQNADTDSGLGDRPPACFTGAVILTSDVPVVAVASRVSDLGTGDQEGVYNGVPQ